MGNEFGHPEWIDFPREGNGNSYDYCRRQWNLVYDTNLRYGQLWEFDKVMNQTEIQFKSMISEHQFVSLASEMDKMIIYEKGNLLFIFNFHGSNSYQDYHVGTKWASDHFIIFDSDEDRFGGHKRLTDAHGRWFETLKEECHSRPNKLRLYIPTRTCIVLCAYENTIGAGEIKNMPQVTDR
jgi:1,4-alpha-glucan branching enzyme